MFRKKEVKMSYLYICRKDSKKIREYEIEDCNLEELTKSDSNQTTDRQGRKLYFR